MVGRSNEIEEMFGGFDVRRNGLAQVGVEVGQARAIYDQVQRTRKARPNTLFKAETGLADISFNHFNFLAKEIAELRAVTFLQTVEYGRFRYNFFETTLGAGGPIAPDLLGYFANIWNLLQQVYHPDFPDIGKLPFLIRRNRTT